MARIYFDEAQYPEEAAALLALSPDDGTVVLGLDLSKPAEGMAELIALRRAGLRTALLPILADALENVHQAILAQIETLQNAQERSAVISGFQRDTLQINGKPVAEFAGYPVPDLDAAQIALRLADTILLRAPGERERWQQLVNRPFRRTQLLDARASADRPPEFDPATVTIYAPSSSRVSLAALSRLLSARRIPHELVCQDNATDKVRSLVVLTPEWRPLRARNLAAGGHLVVAPNTARVADCDDRIFGYEPRDLPAMLAAIDAARSTSRIETSQAPHPPKRVSIIIRTFDRPVLLQRAIRSVHAQTHPDVEIVVVNNGGADVEDIVTACAAERPVQYVRLERRSHISVASNAGARAATGAYVGYLDDDDLLYADHCLVSVDTLERTKADLAYTLCLAEYAKMSGDEKTLMGYQIFMDREYDPEKLFILNLTPIHTVVHRRDLFERFGYFDETLRVTDDWELWLRAAVMGAQFVHIDRVTCEYSWRYDPERGNMTVEHQLDFVAAYRAITERYTSYVAGRSDILAEQAATLAAQERRARDAADPSKRASVVISSMSSSIVPVTPTAALLDY